MASKQKLYCYVDETGQDTEGTLFLVAVVVTGPERDAIASILEHIEQETGKGRVKWMQAKDSYRIEYINRVLNMSQLRGALIYSVYRNTKEYDLCTVETIARAITLVANGPYEATVLIDGQPKKATQQIGTALHYLQVRTRKVRGVRREEADALMRLADAICGFVRAALFDRPELRPLFNRGVRQGFLREA